MSSDFVLKLAGWDSAAPIVWLPGIVKVQRLAIGAWKDALGGNKWDDYSPDMQFMSNQAEPDFVVTLLWIETGFYRGYAVVEQAWLVGPGGGTVDRLSGV